MWPQPQECVRSGVGQWYNTSKGSMITATKAMAIELAPDKIRVNAINPVAGETGMLHLFMGEDTPENENSLFPAFHGALEFA